MPQIYFNLERLNCFLFPKGNILSNRLIKSANNQAVIPNQEIASWYESLNIVHYILKKIDSLLGYSKFSSTPPLVNTVNIIQMIQCSSDFLLYIVGNLYNGRFVILLECSESLLLFSLDETTYLWKDKMFRNLRTV